MSDFVKAYAVLLFSTIALLAITVAIAVLNGSEGIDYAPLMVLFLLSLLALPWSMPVYLYPADDDRQVYAYAALSILGAVMNGFLLQFIARRRMRVHKSK